MKLNTKIISIIAGIIIIITSSIGLITYFSLRHSTVVSIIIQFDETSITKLSSGVVNISFTTESTVIYPSGEIEKYYSDKNASCEAEEFAYSIYIDNTLFSETNSTVWNTAQFSDGPHTLLAKAVSTSGCANETEFVVIVDSFINDPPSDIFKLIAYNIDGGGKNPDWKKVVYEENPDIMVCIETGNLDDSNSISLRRYVNDFNMHFYDEAPFRGYTSQVHTVLYIGEAILSRYPIINFIDIPSVTLDDGSPYIVTHSFIDAVVNISGTVTHFICTHLKAMGDTQSSNNTWRRVLEQQGIINYMDDLGDVPIIYLGDINSFSPFDTGDLATLGDLGYGSLTMLLCPDDPVYGQYSSTVHTFTDVFRTLNPTEIGHTYGHTDTRYNSRIDYIIVNQFFTESLINSTTGDTHHAKTGSDHYSADVFISISNISSTIVEQQNDFIKQNITRSTLNPQNGSIKENKKVYVQCIFRNKKKLTLNPVRNQPKLLFLSNLILLSQ